MSRSKELANVFKKVGDALYQAADELNALAAEVTVNEPAPAPRPSDSVPARPPVEADFAEGSEVICPIHKTEMKAKPWDPTLFGCTKQGTDPAYTNSKGYCTITSKNVAQYLRHRAA